MRAGGGIAWAVLGISALCVRAGSQDVHPLGSHQPKEGSTFVLPGSPEIQEQQHPLLNWTAKAHAPTCIEICRSTFRSPGSSCGNVTNCTCSCLLSNGSLCCQQNVEVAAGTAQLLARKPNLWNDFQHAVGKITSGSSTKQRARSYGFFKWVVQNYNKGGLFMYMRGPSGFRAFRLAQKAFPMMQQAFALERGVSTAWNVYSTIEEVYDELQSVVNHSVGRFVEFKWNANLTSRRNGHEPSMKQKKCLVGRLLAEVLMDSGVRYITKAVHRIMIHLMDVVEKGVLIWTGRASLKLVFSKVIDWLADQLLPLMLTKILSGLGYMLEKYILAGVCPALSDLLAFVSSSSSIIDDLNGYWATPLSAALVPSVMRLLSPVLQRLKEYTFDPLYASLAKPALVSMIDATVSVTDMFVGDSLLDFLFGPLVRIFDQWASPKLSWAAEDIAEIGCDAGIYVPLLDDVYDELQNTKGDEDDWATPSHPSPNKTYTFFGQIFVDRWSLLFGSWHSTQNVTSQ